MLKSILVVLMQFNQSQDLNFLITITIVVLVLTAEYSGEVRCTSTPYTGQ